MEARASTAAAAPSTPVQWKQQLAAERQQLKDDFLVGPSPGELLRRLRGVVDRRLREVWKAFAMPRDIALLAVGGYGRGELSPYSDVDLLILLPRPPDEKLERQLERLIGALWDMGIEVGHSVRTVEDCLQMAEQDITVQTTFLESRLLAGSRALFSRFVEATTSALDPQAFLQAKLLEQQQRHARSQETNLEPNIKESAGGLRDLQTVLWIGRAAGIGKNWAELAQRQLITANEAREIQRHERFLQTLRIRLHYIAGRREDRLLFDHQSALAAQFGLRDTPHRLASEQLMQRYYRAAKAVMQLNTIVLQNLTALIAPQQDRTFRPFNERFGMRGELLEASTEDLYERHPAAMLETFVLLQQHHELKGISAETLRALWRGRRLIDQKFRRDPRNRALFMQILTSNSRVTRELKRMNQYGVLGRYLRAFGRIVGQMQHDLYHVYTVDEHILKVVRNLRRFAVPELAHEFPLCSRLMSDFARPEVLYLAGLFHDIAKGRGGDHSTLGAVDAARFAKAHDISKEDSELIAWLVSNHLVMSATAQKQDISDPAVVRAFADRMQSERRLAALYLLTVADIRGTSPKVWNAWKAKLLEDLYHLTQRLLAGNGVNLDSSVQSRQQEAQAKLRLYALPESAHEKLWAQLDTAYFLRHDPQEIAWHTRILYYRVDTKRPIVKARISPAGEGLQVLVYVPDQKELFARICSFFESISYDIHEAKVYTTRHGYALDTFQVQDPDNTHPRYRDIMSYIEYELGERLLHRTPLPALPSPRLSRQLRHFPISPEVNIQPDDKGAYQVLSVIAGDRPGLLSRIARVLTTYDVNLHTAKVNTLGARAEDVFLISGPVLYDTRRVVRLEAELVEQLRT
ncbi:MAG: bifunctional uridylyltransferase/uridylyl-removing protein [Betaproteobacteria bacterium]|nr:bifunctional uridylyltransferase/uridylyl-removing protein [Betaproteobacteria bacterium]